MKKQDILKVIEIKRAADRPSWTEFWFNLTDQIKKRSVCLHFQVGAVLVRNNQLLSMGYNGPARGLVHCTDVGCSKDFGGKIKKHQGLCRGSHAELNAISSAASLGVNISGSDLYVTYRPCAMCTKAILNSDIKSVFFVTDYEGDEAAWDYFSQSEVEIAKVSFIS